MHNFDPKLLAAITNVTESAPVRGGDYVVVDHDGKAQGKHKDSGPAIRQASKLEDETGKVHQVHRVVDGKIEKSWGWSDSQQRYAPHTDYKGEEAKHIFREEATTVPTKFLGGTYVGKIADSLNESTFANGHYLVNFEPSNTFERGSGKVVEGPFDTSRAKEHLQNQGGSGPYLGTGQDHELLHHKDGQWFHTNHETAEPFNIAHRTVV